jgi:hypothetical protein
MARDRDQRRKGPGVERRRSAKKKVSVLDDDAEAAA